MSAPIVFDRERRSLQHGDRRVRLPPQEAAVLATLQMCAPGAVTNRMICAVCGRKRAEVSIRCLRVAFAELGFPNAIVRHWKVGFQLVAPVMRTEGFLIPPPKLPPRAMPFSMLGGRVEPVGRVRLAAF